MVDALKEHTCTKKKLPLVVCTAIDEKAIAKSHRDNITSLFMNNTESNILGFLGNKCLLSKITDQTTLTNMQRIFSNTKENATLISSITDIGPFYPRIDNYDKNIKFYKVRLVNYNNADLNNMSKLLFEKQCADNNLIIKHKVKYTPDMIIYRVCIDSLPQMRLLKTFEGIYTIEKMLPIRATLDSLDKPLLISPKNIDNDKQYPTVGVLDTGISDNAFLQPWKLNDNFTNYPDEYKDVSHGTFVSGIIEYGDELNNNHRFLLKGVKLFDATVYPNKEKEHIYVDDLIEHIREAIEQNNSIKIWNLSLGTNDESALDEFSDFGMALDNIQDENNVLIIKSAGNCTNFINNKPKSRISKSADSIRAITVGSIAETQNKYDYAKPNMPSPFTRIGPGPSNIIKPDLVFFGGNAGVKNDKLIVSGVTSFAPNGTLASNGGTSFSTPWISRMAAELSFCIDTQFDPLLIKAILIHNAKYPSACEMDMTDKITQMGFGLPSSVSNMLYNADEEITLILRDTLDKGSFVEMFDFPYPKHLIDESGYFTGQIILTLVTKSIIDDKQAGEYCQSNIDIFFGTYEKEKDRDVSKPNIKNPKGVEQPKNILLDTCYSKKVQGIYPQTGFERECTLVKYGKKFHPIKKWAVDLADMTPANKERYLGCSRKWYLKIDGLYRKFIENDSQKHNYKLSQEYCLLITIRDPHGKIKVYDEVSQQLDYNNFVHKNINIRNDIKIDNAPS